jgi:hypothetical protein
MQSEFAPLWLEQAMELCEKVLREAAQRNPQNPAMSKILGDAYTLCGHTSRS